nr:MAG TPA: hypothetical protein [Caudoviricetes sp.]
MRSAKSGWTDVSRETESGRRRRRRPGREALLRITLTKIWVGIVGLMYVGWFVCVMVEALSYGTVG